MDEWWENAACRTSEAAFALAFPAERGTDDTGERTEDGADYAARTLRHSETFASGYCARCPVRSECFAYAMRRRITDGVWGGIDQATRQRWLKNGRKYRCEECGDLLDPQRLLLGYSIKKCERHTPEGD